MKKIKQHNIPSVRIEIKPSSILEGEIGVFATRKLKKDSIVVEASQFACERLIPWSEFNSLDLITRKKVMDYCSGDQKGFYAPPDLNYLPISWQLNHSCNPNVGFDDNYNFVAMKNILPGEELFWDYCYDESNPEYSMICGCGTSKCRGVITGNDWKVLIKNKVASKYLSPDIKRLNSKAKS